MTSIASKVAKQYLHRQGTAVRVAARYCQKVANSAYKHKIVGANARFLWGSSHGWTHPVFLIEELPQKGKKKLGRFELGLTLDIFQRLVGTTSIYFDADTLANASGIGPGDGYKAMVSKLQDAIEKEAKKLVANLESGKTLATAEAATVEKEWRKWLSYTNPREDEVFYLNVMPEGTEPFTAMGKDFQVDVSWVEFKAVDPKSDFQLADPHYTIFEEKSPTAARKMFLTLNADKTALKSVAWVDFGKWLTSNKIPYDIKFSSWG